MSWQIGGAGPFQELYVISLIIHQKTAGIVSVFDP
jgi:hypothetical protein